MSTLLRLFAIVAFNAILLSNTSSLAAGSCEGLFSDTMTVTSLDPSIPYQLLGQYYSSPAPMNKRLASFALKTYEVSIQKALTERGINFETRLVEQDAIDLKWNEFVISPQGTHPLNKFAQSLKRRLGASVTFNPITNMAGNFDASFEWLKNKLQISQAAVLGSLTSVDAHEVIHAYLLAKRLGRIRYMQKAPVGIQMHSESGINPQDVPYNHYMSFEEILTYAFESSYFAKQATKHVLKKNEPEYAGIKDGTKEKVKYLYIVASNAELAAQKALNLLSEKTFQLEKQEETGEQFMPLKTQDEDFLLKVFIPSNNTLSPEAYVAKELNNAIALAKFTKDYIEKLLPLPEDIQLQKIRTFRAAQRAFIDGF